MGLGTGIHRQGMGSTGAGSDFSRDLAPNSLLGLKACIFSESGRKEAAQMRDEQLQYLEKCTRQDLSWARRVCELASVLKERHTVASCTGPATDTKPSPKAM